MEIKIFVETVAQLEALKPFMEERERWHNRMLGRIGDGPAPQAELPTPPVEEKPARAKRKHPDKVQREAKAAAEQQELLAHDGIPGEEPTASAPAESPAPVAESPAPVVEAPVEGGAMEETAVVEAVKAFVGANGARIPKIQEFLAEFGVKKVSEIKPADRAAFVAKVRAAA